MLYIVQCFGTHEYYRLTFQIRWIFLVYIPWFWSSAFGFFTKNTHAHNIERNKKSSPLFLARCELKLKLYHIFWFFIHTFAHIYKYTSLASRLKYFYQKMKIEFVNVYAWHEHRWMCVCISKLSKEKKIQWLLSFWLSIFESSRVESICLELVFSWHFERVCFSFYFHCPLLLSHICTHKTHVQKTSEIPKVFAWQKRMRHGIR